MAQMCLIGSCHTENYLTNYELNEQGENELGSLYYGAPFMI